MLISAFEDYTAARTLLKESDHVWQGAVLGSMAIEKYLKSLLAMKGFSIKEHLSSYDIIKEKLKEANLVLPYEPSQNFLDVLSKSYKFRYFDDIGKVASCGFFWWQLLAEVDGLIGSIESRITTANQGLNFDTRYKKAVKENDPKLVSDNWFVQGEKKENIALRPGFVARYIEERIVVLNFKNPNLSSGYVEFVSAEVKLASTRDQIEFNFTRPILAGEEVLNQMALETFES